MFTSNKYQLFRVQRSDLLYELSGVHVTGMENNIIYVVFCCIWANSLDSCYRQIVLFIVLI